MSPRPRRVTTTSTHPTEHPLPLNTIVIARQSRHSRSWDEALVTSFRVTRGFTLYSLTWKDDSDGSWSKNIPQSRVKAKLPSPNTALLPDQPIVHLSRPAPGADTPHPLPPNTNVFAKQARFSRTWDKATVLSHRVSRGSIQYNLRWETDGSLSDHVPLSLVRTHTPLHLPVRPPSPLSPTHCAHDQQTLPVSLTPPRPPRCQSDKPYATPCLPPPQLVPKKDTTHPLPVNTSVFAKRSKLSRLWGEATILSSRKERRGIQYELIWASDGSLSGTIPQSMVRIPALATSPTQRPPSLPHSIGCHHTPTPPLSGHNGTPPRRPKPNRTAWTTWTPPTRTPPPPTYTTPVITGSIPTGGAILVLYDNWAEAILTGGKTIEVRSQNTTKRGTIFLRKSGTDVVCGSVEVTHTTTITTSREWRRLAPQHKIGDASDPTQIAPFPDVAHHAWHLSNPKRFQSPVKTIVTKGPVTFQKFLPPSSLSRSTTLSVHPHTSPSSPSRQPPNHPDQPSGNSHTRLPPAARAHTTCAVLIQHQHHITRASMRSSHTTASLILAQDLINFLSSRKESTQSSYPFQQEEVAYAVRRLAKRTTVIAQSTQQNPDAPVTRTVWQAMLVAKYTNLSDAQGSAIAHGVYIPRSVGPKHHTHLNSDTSVELGWLATVYGQPSHHHHRGTSDMWRQLNQESYDPNARIPALRRSEQEVASAIDSIGKQKGAHNTAHAHAAIAALQSTGHLVTKPLDSYRHDLTIARGLGWITGSLSLSTLRLDWTFHSRTTRSFPPPPAFADLSPWDQSLIGLIENPADSALFRDAPPSCDNTMKNWLIRHLLRGSHFTHCSGGTAWKKETYTPCNWGPTSRRCHGDSPAHNCGHGRKHPISGAGQLDTDNEVPRTFADSWSHMIPASLYFSIMAGADLVSLNSLHGKCAVHVGSGTGSMRKALQLTGLFVIGIDIESDIDAGTRTEHTSFIADYDQHEGRFGPLVENAIHRFGFSRADVVLIAFDADCSTRSRMTSNMNGKCRDLVTGKPDASKPGGIEAQTRDRIDKQAIQWIDSIVSSHSDAECITNATKWPSGPGGWGLSIEDAHTILTSAPRWDPLNTTKLVGSRDKARTRFRRTLSRPPDAHTPTLSTAPNHPGTHTR